MQLYEVELLREFHSFQAAEDEETLIERLKEEDDRFNWQECTIIPIEIEGYTITVTPESGEAPKNRGGRPRRAG